MWLLFSIACALGDSFATFFNKKLMAQKQHPLSVSLFIHGFGAVMLLLLTLFSGKSLLLDTESFVLVFITSLIAALAGLIILTSLKKGDLSLISPIQTTTPIIVLLLAIFFLSETPQPIGLAGIMLVVFGGVVLDKSPKESFISIARRIISYRPALLALAAASLYAVASVLDKVGLETIDPLVWMTYVYGLIFLILLPVALYSSNIPFKRLKKSATPLLLGAILSVTAIYFQMQALAIGNVTYVMAIKRLSTVFTVTLAILLVRERRALHRLRGTIIMVIGAILIGLS